MPESKINSVSVNILRNLNVSQNFQRVAVRRTNVRSRTTFQQLVSQNNAVTPQDKGNFARRISVRDNQFKNPQDRFFDAVA